MVVDHFGHACVLVETASARLLIDPGTLSSGFEQVRDLDAILITHQHADHLDLTRLVSLMAANPRAVLCVDPGSVSAVAALGLGARAMAPGDRLEIAGAVVDVVGGTHAVVHHDVPVVPNAALVIDDGAVYHPGDSFHVPEQEIDLLLLPISGPWLKLGEAVDFFRAVRPRLARPIHEAALADPALHLSVLERLAPSGSSFALSFALS